MSTLATPSRLSQRERERRGTRGGGSRSVPVPLLAPALISVAFLVLPLAGLIVRVPWGNLWSILQSSDASQALRLSLWTSTVATGVSLVIGVPLAWVLARADFPGLRFLRALVTLPLVLPPVVGGVALLLAFGRNGFCWPVPRPMVRHHNPVQPGRGHHGRDVRGNAILDHHRGRGAAIGRLGV